MIELLIVLGIIVIIYLIRHDSKNADIANKNLAAVGHNALLASIEQELLIKQLGVKKAATVFLDAVENNSDAHPILVTLYEQANLNYAETYDDPKSRTIVLRTLATKFQNTLDQMEDEFDE